MPQPKTANVRIAFVVWYDHYSVEGWHEQSELVKDSSADADGMMCVSVGILAYEDDKIVKLSTTVSTDSGIGDLMCILRPTIKQIFTIPLTRYIKDLRDGTKCATMQHAGQGADAAPPAKESKVKPKPKKPPKPKGPSH